MDKPRAPIVIDSWYQAASTDREREGDHGLHGSQVEQGGSRGLG